jgi:tetratricopeptide (TPR) repeat protein
VLCALGTIGWFGAERDRAVEGNAHYDAGRYEEAETAYGEGLVDYPESERLRFNLGTAQYREGNFADAVATLEKLLPDLDGALGSSPDDVSGLAAGAAHNIGNARFRLGQEMEEQNPQQALALYDQALSAYKRAMGFAPDDDAPKVNHEFVERHALALKERLEQEQDQQEQDQQQDPQSEEEQQAGDEKQKQAPGDDASDGEEPSPEDQQAAGEQPSEEDEDEPQPEGQGQRDEAGDDSPEQHGAPQGGATPGEESPGDQLSRSEAQSLIDTARGEEVDPSELRPLVDAAGIGAPREDW